MPTLSLIFCPKYFYPGGDFTIRNDTEGESIDDSKFPEKKFIENTTRSRILLMKNVTPLAIDMKLQQRNQRLQQDIPILVQ
jgi:hypothetical protein